MTGALRPLSVSTPASSAPMPARRSATWSTRQRHPARTVAGDQPADRVAGGGVDRGELPDRPDALGACRQRRCRGRPGRPGGRRSGRTQTGRPWRPWSRCRWWPRSAGPARPPAGRGGRVGGGPAASGHPTATGAPHGRRGGRPAGGRPGSAWRPPRPVPLDLVGWGRGRHHRRAAPLGQQRGQAVPLGAAGPTIAGRARDPEGAAGLGHAGLAGPVQDLDTPVVDDLCWGHGGGLLRLFGRNQRVHQPHPQWDLQPQPVISKN
jgi:hypothetical protein